MTSERLLRVLLVEDDPRDAADLSAALARGRGAAHATHVGRLSEALPRLNAASVDVALVSLRLPDSVGLGTVTCARAVAPQVPIVALAPPEDEPLAAAAAASGAQEYLLKRVPLDGRLVCVWLRYLVERHRILNLLASPPGGPLSPSLSVPRAPAAPPSPPAPQPPPQSCEDLAPPAEGTRDLSGKGDAPPAASLRPGDALGGYVVERLLGSGGMGSVYLAIQRSLERKVAVKVIADRFNADPFFVRRFEREASALANLSHPNIVVIHDKGIHQPAGTGGPERCYIVMEYVDGMSLREVLQQRTLTLPETLKIVPHLCEAMDYAHAQGVVHRDIKPENLLFTRSGQIKISDFGLARLMQGARGPEAPPTYTGVVMGTKDYMAPEARSGRKAPDHRADIYSLGVVLYEMLTGELPVGRFAAPSRKAPVDPRIDAVVMRALEADPEARYPRAIEMGQDILRVVRSDGASPKTLRSPPADVASREGRLYHVGTPVRVEFPSRSAFRKRFS